MNVWIALKHYDYEGSELIGIAATAERAKELAQAERYRKEEYEWTWNENLAFWFARDSASSDVEVRLEEVAE